ncbi:hypothetical protein P8935_17955 [Telmatobacter sp. DSM 110680]|uniref:Outer membrane lipoprotein-sorting protein n=1 Tax=Telmatobacter sp. DSM 110680 TaxID=3036704 RepID=A0AAU7DF63_9BACT
MPVRFLAILILFFPLTTAGQGGAVRGDDSLVKRALENEIRAAGDTQHPMRYRLRKSSPRLISTKEILETKDGAVARLLSVNDAPLSAADEQKEQARLAALLNDPARQRHRKQAEDDDSARALKVLRSLPTAFVYHDEGSDEGAGGEVEKFAFTPDPKFNAPNLETQILTQMTGEIWIDKAQERVVRLEGHLQQDVDFGWGILGQLNKGGWILIEQSDVGDHQWHVVHFKMKMTGRVIFKTKVFDTTEDESQFASVPAGTSYKQAIQMMQAEEVNSERGANAPANR